MMKVTKLTNYDKVYLVIESHPNDKVHAVFSTKELAQNYIIKMTDKDTKKHNCSCEACIRWFYVKVFKVRRDK